MAPRFIITTGLMLVLAAGVQADPPKDAKDSIKNAIKAGRAYLENAYRPGGPGGGPPLPGDIARIPGVDKMMPFGHQIGSACLAGLAILEAGGSADNPAVANIAGTTRKVALSVTSTYELSLMIMFFDRLGSKADQPLIQFLTLRLLSGQCADGSWAYVCNGIQLDPVQERQLAAELVKEARLTTPDEPRPGAKKKDARPREDIDFGTPKKDKPKEEPKEKPKPKEEKKGLHPALEKFVGVAPAPGNIGPPGGGRNIPIPGEFGRQHTGDHSNTQFATVGLWCGRRHYVDVSAALSLLDQHYRKVQNNQDGGWSYTQSGGSSTAAMTCAGLMGLAMGFGAKNLDATGDLRAAAQDEFAKDLAVANGLKFLGNILAAGPALNMASGDHVAPGVQPGMNYYFMWSLERVGMVYGLTTIGKVDWYEWGAEGIVKSQRRDGSWHSNDFHSGSPENSTSFALLFLCRANLADDLSTSLKGKVKDPGTSRLVRSSDLSKYIGGSGSSGSSGPKRP
ncbi:MAG TPA: hypothetical protein VKD90_00850, partial [Gemmataceae bacterium]|nr:hypothetical protein [Gemmataceae bacterium]